MFWHVLQYENTLIFSFMSSVTDFCIEASWLRFHWTELFDVWAVRSLRKILAFYGVPPLLVLHVYYFVGDMHWKIRGSKIHKTSLLLAPTHSPEFAASNEVLQKAYVCMQWLLLSISPFKQLSPWKSESLCTCRIRLDLTLFANQWHRICTLQLNLLLIYENNETSCNSSLSLVQTVKPCMHDRKAEAKP